MANFAERFKELRQKKGWSQQRLAEELNISKSSVNMYERGEREPSFETLESIADLFNVDMNFLMGTTPIERATIFSVPVSVPAGFSPLPDMDTLPRVGRIACGVPILAEQNIEDYDSVPSGWRATFTLICVGDSMAPRIQDGDLVAIRQQKEVESGEIAAVRIGDEATLKRVYFHNDYIELRPENPAYSSIIRRREEMNDVSIEGRAVGFCRSL